MVNSLPITMATAAAPLISAGFSDMVCHARVSYSWGVLGQAKLILWWWRRVRKSYFICKERFINQLAMSTPGYLTSNPERSIERSQVMMLYALIKLLRTTQTAYYAV